MNPMWVYETQEGNVAFQPEDYSNYLLFYSLVHVSFVGLDLPTNEPQDTIHFTAHGMSGMFLFRHFWPEHFRSLIYKPVTFNKLLYHMAAKEQSLHMYLADVHR